LAGTGALVGFFGVGAADEREAKNANAPSKATATAAMTHQSMIAAVNVE
jgi:hypothetical protein